MVPAPDRGRSTMPNPNSTDRKLSDTQLVILSAAAARDGLNVLPTPASLKARGGALANVLKGLLSQGLIEEVRAGCEDTEWRRDEDDNKLALRLTDRGHAAVGLGTRSDQSEEAVQPVLGKTTKNMPAPQKAGARASTKAADVIRLLKRKRGASINELMETSGWQAHSVRGFLSGTCKKKMGLTVLSEKSEAGERCYRIEA